MLSPIACRFKNLTNILFFLRVHSTLYSMSKRTLNDFGRSMLGTVVWSLGNPMTWTSVAIQPDTLLFEASLRLTMSPFLSVLCTSVDSGRDDRLLIHVLFPISSECFTSFSSFLADDSHFVFWQFLTCNSMPVAIFGMVRPTFCLPIYHPRRLMTDW